MLANHEPQVTSLQNIVHFVPKSILVNYQEQTYTDDSLTASITITQRKIMNHEFFCLDEIQNKGRKNFSRYLAFQP